MKTTSVLEGLTKACFIYIRAMMALTIVLLFSSLSIRAYISLQAQTNARGAEEVLYTSRSTLLLLLQTNWSGYTPFVEGCP